MTTVAPRNDSAHSSGTAVGDTRDRVMSRRSTTCLSETIVLRGADA